VWLKDWRRRYFKLIGNQLHFSKTPEEAPHGVIDLSSCLTVKSASDKTGKKYSFEVATPDQTFFMYADSEEEKDNWIG
ncbi:PH1, partial [Symbiodinium sp. KB8]